MLKLLLVLPPALLLAMLPQQPAATPGLAIPPDAAALTNPVKPTPESRAHAKTVYGMDCAICHGANGDGKGDVVADMHLSMKDFTNPATLKDRTDGELFYIIKNGDAKSQMPPEGPRAKDDDIWNLVIYVRSLSSK